MKSNLEKFCCVVDKVTKKITALTRCALHPCAEKRVRRSILTRFVGRKNKRKSKRKNERRKEKVSKEKRRKLEKKRKKKTRKKYLPFKLYFYRYDIRNITYTYTHLPVLLYLR